MKQSLAIALAAGLSQVTATGFHKFPSFPVPGNCDNVCDDKQKGGYGFLDLPSGDFSSYGSFDFKGWTCKDGFGKRGEVGARTIGQKAIVGTCVSDKTKCPSFGSKDKFSIGEYHVDVEFDCDLEFHYDMPDGSKCKQRKPCKKGGSIIKNEQCGGATSVTVVYPSQTAKPKPSCSVGFTSISFDCNSKSSTVPPKTYPTSSPSKPTSSVVTIPTPSVSKPGSSTGFSYPVGSPSSSAPSVPVSSAPSVPVSSAPSVPVSSVPVSSAPSVPVSSVPSVPVSSVPSVPVSSGVSSTAPVASTPISSVPSVPVSSPVTSTIVTSYQSTSTIVTTIVSTVTSCAPTVPNCPAESASVTKVTVTSVVGTTICPVTETKTTVISTPVPTYPAGQPSVSVPVGQPSVSVPVGQPSVSVPVSQPSVSVPVGQPSVSVPAVSSNVPVPASSTSTAPGPIETLPCPNVVPSCLNTWLFSSGCADNTDAACFCPDSKFIENVFSCVYSYGESDEVIASALSFVQGICAAFVPTNPGIATGVQSYTTVLTAQPTIPPAATYTTILVTATTVVPCTNSAGEVIPSSSSTQVISTAVTVPQVGFSTVTPAGPEATPSVVPVVPTGPAAAPGVPGVTVTSTRAPAATGGSGSGSGSGPVTTFTTAKPVGTGSQTAPSTTGVPVTAGAASISSSFALVAGAVLAVLAAF